MKTTPYDLIRQGKPVNEILRSAAALSDFELEKIADEVPDSDITNIGEHIFQSCKAVGVQRVLIHGGCLELFGRVSREDKQPEVFAEMYTRLGIKRSLAYECRAVWRRFGSALTNSPNLGKAFVAESLKILSREKTSESAAVEAIELAKSGAMIDIATAKSLSKKHSGNQVGNSKPTSSKKSLASSGRKAVAKAWSFAGRAVQIVLTPRSGQDPDVNAVIRDLRAAIEDLERVNSVDERVNESYGAGEPTHV